MEDLEYPLDAIEIIGNIYTNSTTMYIGEYFEKIEPIHIQKGTIHGNTLSPYLFILFLEPLLRWLQRDQKATHSKHPTHTKPQQLMQTT
jgi:hypothetical protein